MALEHKSVNTHCQQIGLDKVNRIAMKLLYTKIFLFILFKNYYDFVEEKLLLLFLVICIQFFLSCIPYSFSQSFPRGNDTRDVTAKVSQKSSSAPMNIYLHLSWL